MTPTNDAPVTGIDRLWCLHVFGPDDVYPAPDRATAQLWAAQWTVYWHRRHPLPRLYDPVMSWIVAEWPHDAASHAHGLAKSIADNTWPVDPLAALASAPAEPFPLSDAERAALQKIMQEQELSAPAVWRQALRSYQMDHERRKAGETVTWSGDAERAREFAGPLASAPAGHSDDIAVDRFADAMKAKLAKARDKGRGGWDDPAQCTVEHLRDLMNVHVAKGDPVDAGNFCMMLFHRGGSTSAPAGDGVEEIEKLIREHFQGAVIHEDYRENGHAMHDEIDACKGVGDLARQIAALARPHSAVAPAGDGDAATEDALMAGRAVMWGQGDGTYDEAVAAIEGLVNALDAALDRPRAAVGERVFQIGDRVEKVSGSSWRGKVVGTYATSLTPEGYCVESETETGSVQIYPAKALRLALQAPPAKVEG